MSCHTSTTLQTSIARFVSDSWASCSLSRRNTFVEGTCALPSALLVLLFFSSLQYFNMPLFLLAIIPCHASADAPAFRNAYDQNPHVEARGLGVGCLPYASSRCHAFHRRPICPSHSPLIGTFIATQLNSTQLNVELSRVAGFYISTSAQRLPLTAAQAPLARMRLWPPLCVGFTPASLQLSVWTYILCFSQLSDIGCHNTEHWRLLHTCG